MDKDNKKKLLYGKNKISKDKNLDEKPIYQNPSKITNSSFSQDYESFHKQIPYYGFGYIPVNILEIKNFEEKTDSKKSEEADYHTIIAEKKEKIKKVNEKIKNLYDKKEGILETLKEPYEKIRKVKKNIISKIYEIKDYEYLINNLKNDLINIQKLSEKLQTEKEKKKKLFERYSNQKSEEILLFAQKLEEEKNNLSNMKIKKDENKKKILDEEINVKNKIQEINDEKLKQEKLIQEKNKLKEEYEKVNKVAINDNKFCHDNFYSLLTFFPYFKNVAFISNSNEKIIEENKNENENVGNFDENKIITEEEINYDIEKENIQNIKNLINQKENSDKNVNFKILKDRRTLQINPKEKYKFKKIFSIINNNYIAEPWTYEKYNSLKLSTINGYFNEFNMTAISNNYFIIYFLPNIDKTTINNELFKLFQKLKNNEYIDKNMIIKISAITESTYINLQNINQESKIKNQLLSIKNAGIHTIFGFLYEFTKTNRLNKKNIFRIYNFDYSYPYAVDMMNSINKYYAKKKRKKTGVYKKVIRGQGKQKKKQQDRSTSNNNINKQRQKSNINNNKKNNGNNKVKFKNNVTKGNIKKNNNIVASNQNNRNNSFIVSDNKNKTNTVNISKQNTRNNSYITSGQNNKNNKGIINKKTNNNVSEDTKNNIKKVNFNSNNKEDKKILKKSGSQAQSLKKEKSKIVNLTSINNNIKTVKFDNNSKSTTPRKNNSANKEAASKQKGASLVFNDLKLIKPEHTLVIHDIYSEFVNTSEFKQVAKACGVLNNSEK